MSVRFDLSSKKYYNRHWLVWIFTGVALIIVALAISKHVFSEWVDHAEVEITLVGALVTLVLLAGVYWYSALQDYIVVCQEGVTTRLFFNHKTISIPWSNVSSLEPIEIEGKKYELGMVLREPIESIAGMSKLQKWLFQPTYVSEKAIALSPFMDREKKLLVQVKVLLRQYGVDRPN